LYQGAFQKDSKCGEEWGVEGLFGLQ